MQLSRRNMRLMAGMRLLFGFKGRGYIYGTGKIGNGKLPQIVGSFRVWTYNRIWVISAKKRLW
jgi:hypothetical protein